MEAIAQPCLVDEDGDPRPDLVAAWLEAQREQRGLPPQRWVAFVAQAAKVGERTVERWRNGTRKPEPAARRALRLALTGPPEAEAMAHLRAALAALQRPTEASRIKGGGGADGSAGWKASGAALARAGAEFGSSPSSPPPSLDQQMILAWMEAHPGMTEDEARGQLGVA